MSFPIQNKGGNQLVRALAIGLVGLLVEVKAKLSHPLVVVLDLISPLDFDCNKVNDTISQTPFPRVLIRGYYDAQFSLTLEVKEELLQYMRLNELTIINLCWDNFNQAMLFQAHQVNGHFSQQVVINSIKENTILGKVRVQQERVSWIVELFWTSHVANQDGIEV